MKKFLTVLLALSVVFTYSFSSVGAVFADEGYTVSSAREALNLEASTWLDAVQTAKNLAVKDYTYDEDTGLSKVEGLQAFDKAAVDAAINALAGTKAEDYKDGKAYKTLDAAVNEQVNKINVLIENGTAVTDLTAYKNAIANAIKTYSFGGRNYNLIDSTGFANALKADTVTLNESKEKTTYDKVMKDIAENYALNKYPADGEFTDKTSVEPILGTYTAQQVVADAVAAAKEAIAEARKTVTDADKTADTYVSILTTAITAYGDAYDGIDTYIAKFKNAEGKPVMTLEEIKDAEDDADKENEGTYASLSGYALKDYYQTMIGKVAEKAAPYDLTTFVAALGATDENDPLYVEADATKKTNAVVVGVEVKDITEATRTEFNAIKDAFYKAINDTLAVAKVYSGTKGAVVADLYDTDPNQESVFTGTIKKALTISDVYAKVKAHAEGLKDVYRYGVKVYDNAKVDAVIAAAEAVVYADLVDGFGTDLTTYIKGAIAEAAAVAFPKANISDYEDALDAMKVDGYETLKAKFEAAQDEAKAKFTDPLITSGIDPTPEADKIYKAALYDENSTTVDNETYTNIKDEAIAAITAAQNYEDIDAALATAREKLAQLVLKADADAVQEAKDKALEVFEKEIDKQKVKMGSDYDNESFVDVKTAGDKLINQANTVAAVEAAAKKAEALIATIKTKAEIEAAQDAVLARINALPLSTEVKLENKAEIEAARVAYDELAKMFGSDAYGAKAEDVTEYAKLAEAETALAKFVKADLEEELEALADKIVAIGAIENDKAAEAAVALKAEAKALKAKVDAYNKDNTAQIAGADFTAVADFVDESFAALGKNTIYKAELYLAEKATNMLPQIIKASDKAAIEAARAAFETLTDVQQYVYEDNGTLAVLENAEAQLKEARIAAVKAFDISTKTELVKGKKMIVKWTVKGDESAIDGYRVYYSTKKSDKGFKVLADVKGKKLNHNSIKKTVKKGTRVYYRVKAYAMIDGLRYLSTYSSAGHRTWK